ncbi:uncharacterized protein [Solanum lycopersicum]|uniref:uncharacterized protein n=1 Tax=Solanum lycopersicum TaxID=4081 RepID=UPI00374801C1
MYYKEEYYKGKKYIHIHKNWAFNELQINKTAQIASPLRKIGALNFEVPAEVSVTTLRELAGDKSTGAGIGAYNISGASDGVIEVEGILADIDGVTALVGISVGEAAGDDAGEENTGADSGFSITEDDGVSAGEIVFVGDIFTGEADGLIFGDSGTGDDEGVITGVLNFGRGVITDGSGAATVDDGVFPGEFIGETNGVDAGTIDDALGDIAGVMTGVLNLGRGVIADGTGAATLDDGIGAGEFIGETNGVDAGTIDDALGDIAGVITGVLSLGRGVIADGTGAATFDDGIGPGELIGEIDGEDAGTFDDALGDIVEVFTGLSGVALDGTGALSLNDGVLAGEIEVVGGVLDGD